MQPQNLGTIIQGYFRFGLMRAGGLRDRQIATEIFTGLSREMSVRHASFTTFLAGAGPNFE